MSQTILVPLDGSPLAELALDEAQELARLPGSNVIFLQVIAPAENVISDGEEFAVDQQWERQRIDALRYLEGIRSRPEWKSVRTQMAVEMGNPAEVILDLARKLDVRWIVMSTHGRTGVNRWVYGSVATKVLEAADRTVVLVRSGVAAGSSNAARRGRMGEEQ